MVITLVIIAVAVAFYLGWAFGSNREATYWKDQIALGMTVADLDAESESR